MTFVVEFWFNLGWETQVQYNQGCYIATTSKTFTIYFDNTNLKIQNQSSNVIPTISSAIRPNSWRNYVINLSNISGNVLKFYLDFKNVASLSGQSSYTAGIDSIILMEGAGSSQFFPNVACASGICPSASTSPFNHLCSGMKRNLKVFLGNNVTINTLKYFNFV